MNMVEHEFKCFPIPIDKIYYKFIVDGEWYTSDEDKTERDDNGNVNNVLMDTECVISIDDYDTGMEGSDEIIINHHDLDATSEFTSISHPNSDTIWEEIEQVVEGNVCSGQTIEGEEEDEEEDYDVNSGLNSSVQITLKDSSSIAGSIHSRNISNSKKYICGNGNVNGSGGSASGSGNSSGFGGSNGIIGSDFIMSRIRSMFNKRDM
ncbi:hypothetical protein C6P40_005290 [Pichia californica]|uniref:AMP-activated protein kinase glycogen-binding domain-containing protein n=1 Tax=Pichia californica TaxID=460514 RepID=A0A9P6WRB1_9ASCO|nr:hypothetical protein C6P42_000097 [[Candida] californica]KAG0691063.1 hypothetical protein C6P40_005290 [[Candida] californica]